jgi:hypothetical protein
VGFNGGYYVLGELTNPSGITPFGPHGPGFPVVWGAFGALVGIHRHSSVVLNLLAISVAAWIWTALSRLTTGRIGLSGALLVTFWPMVFWAPTSDARDAAPRWRDRGTLYRNLDSGCP